MYRKIEVEKTPVQKTQEFVKKNWPIALVVAGAAGAIGAAVWLTARYLREKKQRNPDDDEALELAENEVTQMTDPTAIMLETGTFLGQVVGSEAEEATLELSKHINDQDVKDALSVLGSVTQINSKKTKNKY